MPYVNIKITREGGTTAAQKTALIKGVTDVLVEILGKSPATTFVVIDEVDMVDWGIGGLPVEEYRKRMQRVANAKGTKTSRYTKHSSSAVPVASAKLSRTNCSSGD